MKRKLLVVLSAACLMSGCSYTLEKVTPAGAIPPALGLQPADSQDQSQGTEPQNTLLSGATSR